MQHTLETALTNFLSDLRGCNLSDHTYLAYQTDIRQFIVWIHGEDVTITTPQQVNRAIVMEYLASLFHIPDFPGSFLPLPYYLDQYAQKRAQSQSISQTRGI